MRKHRVTQLLTVLLLASALGIGVARKTAGHHSEPQDTVYALLDAARAGNVQAYLSSHGGPMEASLRQTLSETTEADFAKYLRDSVAGVKGVAVYDPQITGATATVRVEYIYQDRNEAQTMYLEQGPKGWKIFRADGGERIKTLVPYGTPVK